MAKKNTQKLDVDAVKLDDLFSRIDLPCCPFCGREATIVMHPGTNWDNKKGKNYNVGAMHRLWFVGCSYAFFEGLDAGRMCEVLPSASWFARLDDAILQWSQRAK